MVLNRPFTCPTEIRHVDDSASAAAALIGGRSWALVTSRFWMECGGVAKMVAACGDPAAVVSNITPNPDLGHLLVSARKVPTVDFIVALGGGSVIDAAKAISALICIEHDEAMMRDHLVNGAKMPIHFDPTAIIAIPTTSGTGSEVTPWGTIWGDDGIKFSVNDLKLRPSHALLDPSLTLTMPRDLTLAGGLDALSHAMEAIWNRNHNALTDAMSRQSIQMICRGLPHACAKPDDLMWRREMQNASLLAGLSIGTTQTALAHSISYPFTAGFGMPHGIACSFTLGEIARFNSVAEPDRVALIADAFGCELASLPDAIETWLDRLKIGDLLGRYVRSDMISNIPDNLINRSRAANNIREADGPVARGIAEAALARFIKLETTVAAQ